MSKFQVAVMRNIPQVSIPVSCESNRGYTSASCRPSWTNNSNQNQPSRFRPLKGQSTQFYHIGPLLQESLSLYICIYMHLPCQRFLVIRVSKQRFSAPLFHSSLSVSFWPNRKSRILGHGNVNWTILYSFYII